MARRRRENESPTVQVAVRFPIDLVDRVERYREALNKERPGLSLSRADVIRVLVHERLDSLDQEARKAK